MRIPDIAVISLYPIYRRESPHNTYLVGGKGSGKRIGSVAGAFRHIAGGQKTTTRNNKKLSDHREPAERIEESQQEERRRSEEKKAATSSRSEGRSGRTSAGGKRRAFSPPLPGKGEGKADSRKKTPRADEMGTFPIVARQRCLHEAHPVEE